MRRLVLAVAWTAPSTAAQLGTAKATVVSGTFAGKVKPSYGGGTMSGSFTC